MTIETLQYVYAAYKCGSYKEAAYMTNSTYSVVAKQVAKAEEELGCRLFERASKSKQMELTEAGELVIQEVSTILDSYYRIQTGIESMHIGSGESVYIGYGFYYPCEEELEIMAQYCHNYPRAVLSQVRLSRINLRKQLELKTLDGIFVYRMSPQWEKELKETAGDEYAWEVVSTNNKLHFLMSPENPLACRSEFTKEDAEAILKQKIIRINTDNGKSRGIPPFLMQYFGKEWNEIQTAEIDGSNLPLLPNILKQPNLLYPTARRITRDIDDIVSVPVEDWQERMWLLFYYRKDNNNPGLKHFLETIHKFR